MKANGVVTAPELLEDEAQPVWTSAKAMKEIDGMSVSWHLQEADAGRLPHIRVGRRVLFDRDGCLRVIEARASRRVTVEDALANRARR